MTTQLELVQDGEKKWLKTAQDKIEVWGCRVCIQFGLEDLEVVVLVGGSITLDHMEFVVLKLGNFVDRQVLIWPSVGSYLEPAIVDKSPDSVLIRALRDTDEAPLLWKVSCASIFSLPLPHPYIERSLTRRPRIRIKLVAPLKKRLWAFIRGILIMTNPMWD